MESYVRVREIFRVREDLKQRDAVMRRLNELYSLPRVLTRGEQDQLIDLENRLRSFKVR